MKTMLCAFAAAAALTAPSAAQQAWSLDPAASEIGFSIAVFGNAVEGRFEDAEARIVFDPADLSNARIEAVVRTGSGSVEGESEYQDAMDGSAGLHPASHPEARFVSETIRAAGGGYEAEGTLAIKGAERPLTLPFTVEIDGDVARAQAEFVIDRRDFGVHSSSWSNVAEAVTIRLDLVANATE